MYKIVLEENLFPSALTMFPNSEVWVFQQDSAPYHTARSIKMWMEHHKIKTLSWPVQSPNLNLSENLLIEGEDGCSQAIKNMEYYIALYNTYRL